MVHREESLVDQPDQPDHPQGSDSSKTVRTRGNQCLRYGYRALP